MFVQNFAKAYRAPLAVGLGLLTGGSASFVSIDAESKRKAVTVIDAGLRITSLVGTVGVIATDYLITLKVFKPRSSEHDQHMAKLQQYQADQEVFTLNQWKSTTKEEEQVWKNKIAETREKINSTSDELANLSNAGGSSSLSQLHTRSAERLRRLCVRNKGVYIKLGQHLSQLDHILPEEYTSELRLLLADNPVTSPDAVRRVLTEELKQNLDEVFQEIDYHPIASASLAQVHIAYGKDGQKYAVKVQHEGLREGSVGDLIAITFIVNFISRIFKGFNYNWLTREMNMNLPLELDFREEAKNSRKCFKLLKPMIDRGEVVVPEVIHATERVLCMSFEEGQYISKNGWIESAGLSKADIAKSISRIFSDQIFRHGFVHCDPHEANLLVRPHPTRKGKSQIVLLDHGLYRTLDDQFRVRYNKLWRGIINADEAEIRRQCEFLKAGKMYTLLTSMLTMRPWDDVVSKDFERLKQKGTKGDGQMLRSYANKYLFDIVNLLGNVPSHLLLVLKTNDCVRHLDRTLGVPTNSVIVVAETIASVLFWEDLNESGWTLVGVYKAVVSYLSLMTRIVGLKAISAWVSWCA